MLEVLETNQSLEVAEGISILKNFDDFNNEDMPSEEEEENEDDPELLADLEQKQEDLIEEFMGMTFDLKTEKVDEMRAKCKAEGLSRDETKAKVSELDKKIVVLRRKGVKALKSSFTEIVESEEYTLTQKVQYFADDANLDIYHEQMEKLL